MNKVHMWFAKMLSLYGGDFGDWLLHKLGWYAFRCQDFTRAHLETCTGGGRDTQIRPGGYFKRCTGCGQIVHIHFAFWETEEGMVPAEVITWLREVIQGFDGVSAGSSGG